MGVSTFGGPDPNARHGGVGRGRREHQSPDKPRRQRVVAELGLGRALNAVEAHSLEELGQGQAALPQLGHGPVEAPLPSSAADREPVLFERLLEACVQVGLSACRREDGSVARVEDQMLGGLGEEAPHSFLPVFPSSDGGFGRLFMAISWTRLFLAPEPGLARCIRGVKRQTQIKNALLVEAASRLDEPDTGTPVRRDRIGGIENV